MKKIFLMWLLFSPLAFGQDHIGHGGDPIGTEVGSLIEDILSQADQQPNFRSALTHQSYEDFKKILIDVPIKPVSKLKLDGREVTMMNYSDPASIEVSRKGWKTMKSYAEKKMLVLHEILGATNEEPSETYRLTSTLLPLVSCGVRIYSRAFDNDTLLEMKRILIARGYQIVQHKTDFELMNIGNLVWLKNSNQESIWSGEWRDQESKENWFPNSNRMPECGGVKP